MSEESYWDSRINEGICDTCGSDNYTAIGITSDPFNSYAVMCIDCKNLFCTGKFKIEEKESN